MKKNQIYVSLCLFFLSTTLAFSQMEGVKVNDKTADTTLGWKTGGNIGLNASSSGQSNWMGGGRPTISLLGLFGFFANKKEANTAWDNSLSMKYGTQKIDSASFTKSDDELSIASKYGVKATDILYYAALLQFKSQLDAGYKLGTPDVLLSRFLAPAYLNLAIGLDYKPMPSLSIFASPVGANMLIVTDQFLNSEAGDGVGDNGKGAFGIDAGKSTKLDIGAGLKAVYKSEIMKNINFESNFASFAPYSEITHWKVDWKNNLFMKVNEFVNAGLSTQTVYDPNVVVNRDDNTQGPATQFKYVISLGVGYLF